jgi:hypothetical protein
MNTYLKLYTLLFMSGFICGILFYWAIDWIVNKSITDEEIKALYFKEDYEL